MVTIVVRFFLEQATMNIMIPMSKPIPARHPMTIPIIVPMSNVELELELDDDDDDDEQYLEKYVVV